MQRLNWVGKTFGRWTVVEDAGNAHPGKYCKSQWLCRCICGTEKIIDSGELRRGRSRSCGCLRLKHGHLVDGQVSNTWYSWHSMIQRCTNPRRKSYQHYGAVGVKVCTRWMSFSDFLEDMGERPKGTTLSRFRDTGDYEPGNCAWHTKTQQEKERRNKLSAKTV